LPYTAQKLAQIRNLPAEEIYAITTENGKRLYKL
jgi:Tat protein secretion system quality control protein TatD with DNase activity